MADQGRHRQRRLQRRRHERHDRGNDSFVELPLRTETNPDRYHRATVDVCYDGRDELRRRAGRRHDRPLRVADHDAPSWTETQDFIVYPGLPPDDVRPGDEPVGRGARRELRRTRAAGAASRFTTCASTSTRTRAPATSRSATSSWPTTPRSPRRTRSRSSTRRGRRRRRPPRSTCRHDAGRLRGHAHRHGLRRRWRQHVHLERHQRGRRADAERHVLGLRSSCATAAASARRRQWPAAPRAAVAADAELLRAAHSGPAARHAHGRGRQPVSARPDR